MAKEKAVVIDFYPNGDAKIGAENYTGGECLTATAPFENLYKDTVKERVMVGDDCRLDKGERVRA